MAVFSTLLASAQANKTGYTRTSALPQSTVVDGSLAGVMLRPPVNTRYDPNRADPFYVNPANVPDQSVQQMPFNLPTSVIVIGLVVVALVVWRMARKG